MKPKKVQTNGAGPKKRAPEWKRNIDAYPPTELSRLKFASEDDIDEAIGLVWGGDLDGMPFELGGDGMSLIVPKVSTPQFAAAGLQFTEKTLNRE